MTTYLQNNWNTLTKKFPLTKDNFYKELIGLYNSENRFYHNLNHIETLLRFSEDYSYLLNCPQSVNFAIWYHDAIYDASKSNNEKKSAELAKSHLTQLGLNEELIENCYNLIIATKTHALNDKLNSFDARFLLDIDLSILASERKKYIEYTKQIRKEYKIYPNFLYKKGRKRVLKHFLEMENIYKTKLFQNLWEEKARKNLKQELASF